MADVSGDLGFFRACWGMAMEPASRRRRSVGGMERLLNIFASKNPMTFLARPTEFYAAWRSKFH
jgi:hypothetical protein